MVPAEDVRVLPACVMVGTGGSGFTVTTTTSVAVQPGPLVTVTVYEVVMVGDAIGLAHVVQLRPVAGAQLYVPPPVAVRVVFEPVQMETSAPALATGVGFTVTVTVVVLVQPAALVPVIV